MAVQTDMARTNDLISRVFQAHPPSYGIKISTTVDRPVGLSATPTYVRNPEDAHVQSSRVRPLSVGPVQEGEKLTDWDLAIRRVRLPSKFEISIEFTPPSRNDR